MSYIHFSSDGTKYGIKTISHNHHQVMKNGLLFQSCDTYEEAQDLIDDLII